MLYLGQIIVRQVIAAYSIPPNRMGRPVFHFKQFSIQQLRSAMRVNTDSILLGSWLRSDHPARILDIGTGTGILCMVAKLCGATAIGAIDNDKQCIAVAKENFRRNALVPVFVRGVSLEKFRSAATFDFVAANLVSADLIRFKKKLAAYVAPGGFLAVSGISKENVPRVVRSFERAPFKRIALLQKKQWAALLMRKFPGTRVNITRY